jgi:hypothetical protein
MLCVIQIMSAVCASGCSYVCVSESKCVCASAMVCASECVYVCVCASAGVCPTIDTNK